MFSFGRKHILSITKNTFYLSFRAGYYLLFILHKLSHEKNMNVEIFFSKQKYTERKTKTKKTGKKSQMISIYGKATKKVNIRMENAIERSSGKNI